jgi:excisionase family DNA binding protein
MQSDLLSYKQASELLGLPLGTLYSMVSKGRIPHKRLGKRLVRFSKNDLTIWLEKNSIEVMDEK